VRSTTRTHNRGGDDVDATLPSNHTSDSNCMHIDCSRACSMAGQPADNKNHTIPRLAAEMACLAEVEWLTSEGE
jgi:hypothetical protein